MRELQRLDEMVDAFAAQMKRKLRAKHAEGYHGWDDSVMRSTLREKLFAHVQRGAGQEVDVANLAAMLWNLDGRPKS